MYSKNEVLSHLRSEYIGVLSEAQILMHYERYVNFEQAQELISRFELLPSMPENLLDIGGGYGSFVIEARKVGIHAKGIDSSKFEIEFARNRLKTEFSQGINENDVFFLGDGIESGFKDESFEMITAWNVLEHVSDLNAFLGQVFRILRPEGTFHFICPNYASLRKEAHYQVLWFPYLSKKRYRNYLQIRSRNPFFLDNFIYPIYKHSLIRELRKLGFTVRPPQHRSVKLKNPNLITSPLVRWLVTLAKKLRLTNSVHWFLNLSVHNPFTRGIDLIATK